MVDDRKHFKVLSFSLETRFLPAFSLVHFHQQVALIRTTRSKRVRDFMVR